MLHPERIVELGHTYITQFPRLPIMQRVHDIAVELINTSTRFEFYGICLRESAEESRPYLYAQFSFNSDPATQARRRNNFTDDEEFHLGMALEIEVLDGGPARVVRPSLQPVGIGTSVARNLPFLDDIPSDLADIQALPEGVTATVTSHIVGAPDEAMIRLTRADIAVIRPAIIELFGPPAIEQLPEVQSRGRQYPTMGF